MAGDVESYDVIIVGIGEIGEPWFELVKGVFNTLPIDPVKYPENDKINAVCDFLHICIPGDLENFNDIVINYANKYLSDIIVVQSTVAPGTTQTLNEQLWNRCVFSPMNGKHSGNNMKKDFLRYTKFIGADRSLLGEVVAEHFQKIGIPKTQVLSSSLAAEWLKVLSTTYFGYMIAWAQEVERVADKYGLSFDELTSHVPEQEDIIPPHYPGIIGGHCVMPNIELIKQTEELEVCNWIEWSNNMKKKREGDK